LNENEGGNFRSPSIMSLATITLKYPSETVA
jgi:hypothetical protein